MVSLKMDQEESHFIKNIKYYIVIQLKIIFWQASLGIKFMKNIQGKFYWENNIKGIKINLPQINFLALFNKIINNKFIKYNHKNIP